ncbi:MAG: alpha/beta hydrolase-fold protein [Planctomycetota bacterium]|nr:alpha/beta hydrolase-fold protein [Planctomycetota bacterium]
MFVSNAIAIAAIVLARQSVPRAPVEPAAAPRTTADGLPLSENPPPARFVSPRPTASFAEAIVNDEVLVAWDPILGAAMEAGRVIVAIQPAHLATSTGEIDWNAFHFDPPILGAINANVGDLEIALDEDAAWWPVAPGALEGEYVVQAILDPVGSPAGIPDAGAPMSEPILISLRGQEADRISLPLVKRVVDDAVPKGDNIELIDRHVEIGLSSAGHLRAAVILPAHHPRDDSAPLRWPIILVVPDGDGSWLMAQDLAPVIEAATDVGFLPQAVWVVLDSRGDWGNHGWMNSPLAGAWERVLEADLLPLLHAQYGASTRAEDRVVVGLGVGGFAALRLVAQRPDLVSAAFVTAPVFPSHRSLGELPLQPESDPFTTTDGVTRSAFGQWIGSHSFRVHCSIEDEFKMGALISPTGRSGRWLDMWSAMLSPFDSATRRPDPIIDASGRISARSAAGWARWDLEHILDERWNTGAEGFSRSWAVLPERDERGASNNARELFDWFNRRCALQAERGHAPPSGRGGCVYLQAIAPSQVVSVTLAVLGPKIRDHFRASLKNEP